MPHDEVASHGGWQVRGEPWDLLLPLPRAASSTAEHLGCSFLSEQPKRTAETRVTVLHQVLSHITKLLQ